MGNDRGSTHGPTYTGPPLMAADAGIQVAGSSCFEQAENIISYDVTLFLCTWRQPVNPYDLVTVEHIVWAMNRWQYIDNPPLAANYKHDGFDANYYLQHNSRNVV